MLNIFLELTPTPKARARICKSGHAYSPIKTKKSESDIQLLIKSHMIKNKIEITSKPLFIKMIFNFQLPRKLDKNQKLLADLDMLYKQTRPDIDNLVKLVADAMNGVVYYDDSQIVKLLCEKKYSKQEGIDLKIIEI